MDLLGPGQSGWLFADGIFKCVFLEENVCILIKMPLTFFLRALLITRQYWLRQLVGAKQATNNYLNHCWPGAGFTNVFLPAIQIRWKFRLAIIPLLAIRSQQIFAHAMTAQLSCHAQNFVVITILESSWEWNEISIEFELRWKPVSETGPRLSSRWVMEQYDMQIYTSLGFKQLIYIVARINYNLTCQAYIKHFICIWL